MAVDTRVAVVTGASSGLGAELAGQLASSGVRVGLLALPDGSLDEVAASIRTRGGTVAVAGADVTDAGSVRTALNCLVDKLGPIDLLVLNAGVGIFQPAVRFSSTAVPMKLALERFLPRLRDTSNKIRTRFLEQQHAENRAEPEAQRA